MSFIALALMTGADLAPRPTPDGGLPAIPETTVPIAVSASRSGTRIKDIASWNAARDNQLVGYGLVIGLAGTGDGGRNAPFAGESLRAMLTRLGIAVGDERARPANIAAVIVTADLPPFAEPGARLDVTVSSIGDASSLRGGTLVMTTMVGADEQIYAVAQGSLVASGFQVQGQAEAVRQGIPTVALMPNGAIVERASPATMAGGGLQLQLRNPDFTTAVAMADTINRRAQELFGRTVAVARDARTVVVDRPPSLGTARFVAAIENLPVATDQPARVVINQRTGTVVMGAGVRISPVVVTHGTLTVRVTEEPIVSQPNPFSDGATVVAPRTVVDAVQAGGTFTPLGGSDLRTLIDGLNALGVTPGDTIAILQSIKSAGALQAQMVVQ